MNCLWRALLILDNAPAHPPGLKDDLLEEITSITMKFLPPNIASLLQPLDQQVISNFKKLYEGPFPEVFWSNFGYTADTQRALEGPF